MPTNRAREAAVHLNQKPDELVADGYIDFISVDNEHRVAQSSLLTGNFVDAGRTYSRSVGRENS